MIRELFFAAVRVTGIPRLMRELLQRRFVTIVVYHRPNPATVDRHFRMLSRAYRPIGLQAYLVARRNGTVDSLPPRSLIITIDDGHESVYRLKPVLLEHRVPVTVFLCSGLVGTNRGFWFSAAGLDEAQRQRLKTVPDEARVAALRAMGLEDGGDQGRRESLNAGEVEELKELVNFQSHTVSHPILPSCSDQKAAVEIEQSRQQLQARLGLSVNALAYPNGSYAEREIRMAQEAGYECGLSMDAGFNGRETPLFALRRVAVPDDCGIHELMVRSSGLWAFLHAARCAVTGLFRPIRSGKLDPKTQPY
jgi:peptidoglycan/xylan/chitin deacetylase (PgdA/CDA1 family)